MDDEIKKEYIKVMDIISEDEFLDKCEKLHHRLGLSFKDSSKLWKPYDGHLYFHDKNNFPFKDFYDDGIIDYPLTDRDISEILSASLLEGIDLIGRGDYAIIYNRESFLGDTVEFIKKDEIYDKNIIDKFKQEELDSILNYNIEEDNILLSIGKNYHDFSSINDLINFLSNYKKEYPSLNWSLNYYNFNKNDFNNIKEVYVILIEFQHWYSFISYSLSLEMSHEEYVNYFKELMDEYVELYKEGHDSYDFWDQYGVNSIIH